MIVQLVQEDSVTSTCGSASYAWPTTPDLRGGWCKAFNTLKMLFAETLIGNVDTRHFEIEHKTQLTLWTGETAISSSSGLTGTFKYSCRVLFRTIANYVSFVRVSKCLQWRFSDRFALVILDHNCRILETFHADCWKPKEHSHCYRQDEYAPLTWLFFGWDWKCLCIRLA